MLLPGPIWRAELDVCRIYHRDPAKQGKQSPAGIAFLDAERDIGNPVFDRACAAGGQGQETLRITLGRVKEVTVAALQGETVRRHVEGRNDVADGRIDDVQSESRCDSFAIAPESGIVYKPLGLRKGFHLNNTGWAA